MDRSQYAAGGGLFNSPAARTGRVRNRLSPALPRPAARRHGLSRSFLSGTERGDSGNNIDVPDLDTLQHALNRAMERHNVALLTPVGQARELAAAMARSLRHKCRCSY